MIIQLSFHHFLDYSARKIFQGILNVLSCLNMVFFQKLMNNVAFSFRHLYHVYWFLLSCHNKRPDVYKRQPVEGLKGYGADYATDKQDIIEGTLGKLCYDFILSLIHI